jgi:hypothetical protein
MDDEITQMRFTLNNKTQKEIKEEAKSMHIPVSGKKEDLIEEILAKHHLQKENKALDGLLNRWADAKVSEKNVKREICLFIYVSMKELGVSLNWSQMTEKKSTVRVRSIQRIHSHPSREFLKVRIKQRSLMSTQTCCIQESLLKK